MSRFQRRRTPGEEQRATTLELFNDLVFVFAITQISHLLLHDLSWRGLGKAAVALLTVWWAWNYTTWVTNELDPDSPVVRAVLIAIMLASLLMAVAIPQAFGSRALLFVGSYVGIQVGRHLFLTFVADPGRERERAGRILIRLSTAGALWLAGGFASGPARPGSASGWPRSRSTTRARSRSIACPACGGCPRPPGTWRAPISPSASSSS